MSSTNGDHYWQFAQDAVRQALKEAGSRKISAIETAQVALDREKKRLLAEQHKIFIGLPTYSTTGVYDEAWLGFMAFASTQKEISIMQSRSKNSLLAFGFNHLWAEGLARRKINNVTHFAMIHGDVAPSRFWVDVLWEEMVKTGADIVSTVIPIKSPQGLTSTGVSNPADPWMVRRLTMTEIMELPETFCIDHLRHAGLAGPDDMMVVNTGCWLVDICKPWADAVDESGNLCCHFTIHDRVTPEEGGTYGVYVAPEDWNFSRMVLAIDPAAKIYATRKVRVSHKGEANYPNDTAWGEEKSDKTWAEAFAVGEPAEEDESVEPLEALTV